MGKIKRSFSRFFKCLAVVSVMAWSAAPQALAEELKDCLVVHKVGGAQVSYVLEDTPVVTFDAENMHIAANALTDDHKLAEVERFTFEKSSSLATVRPGDSRITVTDREVILEGFTPAASASITDMNGRVTQTVGIDGSGMAVLTIADLSTGVYIVSTTDGKTFKIIKK